MILAHLSELTVGVNIKKRLKLGAFKFKIYRDFMFLKATTIALIPALIIQGNRVKKNTPVLAEPEGQREGRVGAGSALSILIIGDSAAAGVGVDHQKDALSGSILKKLEHQFQIEWKLQATTGHRTSHIQRAVTELPKQHYDVVITSVGVNDVTKLTPPNIWIEKQVQLYSSIEEKFSPELIIATAVPPMQHFPALPNPLAWLFGQYAKKMNLMLDRLIEKKPNMQLIQYDFELYQRLNLSMAKDGFHPSKEVYEVWADQIVSKIKNRF